MTLDTNDPNVRYAQLVAHFGNCPVCSPRGECLEGQRLMQALHDAEDLADKQAAEAERGALIEAGLEDCVEEAPVWRREL